MESITLTISSNGAHMTQTTITSAVTFTIPCTATPLPNDCIANDWSNTIVEIPFSSGEVVSGPAPLIFPTGTAEDGSSPSLSSTETETGVFLTPLPTITLPLRPSGNASIVATGTQTSMESGGGSATTGIGPEQSGNAGAGRAGVAGVGALLAMLVTGVLGLQW